MSGCGGCGSPVFIEEAEEDTDKLKLEKEISLLKKEVEKLKKAKNKK